MIATDADKVVPAPFGETFHYSRGMTMKFSTCALALSIIIASPASATVHLVNFSIAGQWFNGNGGMPYGVPDQQSQSGSFTVDDTQAGVPSILSLNYATGSRTWTLADLQPGTIVTFNGGMVNSFDLLFGPGNYVYSNNTASISETGATARFTFCNNCVTFRSAVESGVPEPATWAMLVGGFGATGAALRRRRPRVAFG